MKSKLIAFLFGSWMFGTVLMWWVAAQNFYIVDELLSPPAAKLESATSLSLEKLRVSFRYLSSELNRDFFQNWAAIQLTLAAAILILMRVPPRESRLSYALAVAMTVPVVFFAFYLTPEMIEQGRSLDFIPRNPLPAGYERFGLLHGIYVGADVIKFILGMWVSWRLIRGPAR